MLTYQDYQAVGEAGKEKFILEAITAYSSSSTFIRAVEAQAYYSRKNTEIIRRMSFMEKHGVKSSNVKFFKMRNGFFARMCKQMAGYLLGNGVTLNDEIKAMLGVRFDAEFMRAGLWSLVDGVAWCFWNFDRLITFRATEFVPLVDEMTSEVKAGIKFWQMDKGKPLWVELFEIDGITQFKKEKDDKSLVRISEKTGYKQTIRRDAISEVVVDSENYSQLPIFPFYANELKTSELSDGLKEDIDAYDFIQSDLNDHITQIEGIYWILKNFGGDDLRKLADEIQQFKIAYSVGDRDESNAQNERVEIPYQAKSVALELLTQKMYEDTMTLYIKAMTGGSLTNVAINAAKSDFDIKIDLFEGHAIDVVQSILGLMGQTDVTPKFKRRTLSNDTETISNISMMITDGYVDEEWAIKNNPLISDDDQEDLISRIELRNTGIPPGDQMLDEGVITGG